MKVHVYVMLGALVFCALSEAASVDTGALKTAPETAVADAETEAVGQNRQKRGGLEQLLQTFLDAVGAGLGGAIGAVDKLDFNRRYPGASGSDGYPDAPGSGGYPGAPGSGGYPAAPGSGGYPGAPGFGGYPGAPGSGGYPGAPGFGNYGTVYRGHPGS